MTGEEEKFVYNLEVLGLPQQRAAELAGVSSPAYVLKKPDVVAAREHLRNTLRAKVDISKDDVILGIKSAVDQAVLLADPMAQIAGWREISKMLGYDAPKEVRITWDTDTKGVRRQIAQLPDGDLVKMLEADSVIDGDFYVVKENGEQRH